jgi:hypothetical protein
MVRLVSAICFYPTIHGEHLLYLRESGELRSVGASSSILAFRHEDAAYNTKV